LLAVIVAWLYMDRVLGPWEQYVNVDAGTLKANLGDLYSPWFGTRALLLHHQNPYGLSQTQDIQRAFYGHPIVQKYDDSKAIIDEQRFAYPVYVVFLLAPTIHLSFEALHAWAPVILAALVALAVWLWLQV